jgi:FG-GAP repeat
MQTKLFSAIVRLSATLVLAISSASALLGAPALRTIYETQKLSASDGQQGDDFGQAVSISGNLAIVGAYGDDDKGDSSGSAYIYAFDGTTWNQQAKLTGADEVAFDYFGMAVAISGNMALVAAPRDNTLGVDAGAVYVFSFDGTAWTQQAKLFASGAKDFDVFGISVALSGNIALIGALSANDDRGGAYVFTFDGTSWSQQAKLSAADGVLGDAFGSSVSLSGTRALIGAYSNGIGGAAYVFNFNGTTWSQAAKLTGLDTAADDTFGWTVSLSGNLALVGAPHAHNNRGAAYIFAYDGLTWSQQTKLKDPGGPDAHFTYFGSSVVLSNTVAVIGATHFLDSGQVYEFVLRRNTWALRAQLLASDGMAGDDLGVSVALSGNTVLAGADDIFNAGGTGKAYIFSLGH